MNAPAGINAAYSGADVTAVTALTRAAGTSFYRGMTILPRPRRIAMYGIYAFCRAVDDIADNEGLTTMERHAGLTVWRHRIEALWQGKADDPITRILLASIRNYDLQYADFISVIDGMAMDAMETIVAPDEATLDLYCDRVASAVGRLSVRVFGEASKDGVTVATHLGRALQLTNILRDLGEDAARGRLYLPRELLEAEHVPLTPDAALAAGRLPRVLSMIADRAERKFDAAEAAMRHCDPRAMRPARLMAASYRPLLSVMRARGFANPLRRPSLPIWRKMILAAKLVAQADRGA